MKQLFAISLCLLLAPAALYAAGTITDGDGSVQFIGTPIWSSATGGDINHFPNGGTTEDRLFKYSWYYRQQFNNINRIFSSLDTPVESYVGNTMTASYTNAGPGPAGQGRFNAFFNVQYLDGPGTNVGRIEATLTFTAATSNTGPVTWEIFNLADWDFLNTEALSLPGPAEVRIRQQASDTYAEHLGLGATRYEAGTSSALRTKVSSGSANLANTIAAGDGDWASALQWTVTLNPGQSITIKSGISRGIAATPEPASLALLALAGLLGFRRR